MRWLKIVRQRFGRRAQRIADLVQRQYSGPDTHFIAVSHKVAADIHARHQIPWHRIQVVHNGVDLQRYRPELSGQLRSATRGRLGIHDGELVLLTVAHNHRLKGVSRLLRLLRLPQARGQRLHLVVVGGHRQEFRQEAIHGNRVSFVGARQDVRSYYAAADVFVLATYYDACSLTVMEAMASGLPAITTRCNGAAGVMTAGLQELVYDHPDDVQGLWSLVQRCADVAYRRRMGVMAHDAMQGHSLDENFRGIELLYHLQCANRKAA